MIRFPLLPSLRPAPLSSRRAAALLAACLALAACGRGSDPLAAGAGAAELPAPPPPSLPRGQVRIQPASLQVLRIEPVTGQRDTAVVWAPARVVFQDDRVTSVGAPAAGRVVEVHARIGDAVRTGAPLATLSSPDAARVRTELSAAGVELELARVELRRQRTMFEKGVGIASELAAAEGKVRALSLEAGRARNAAAYLGGGAQDRLVLRSPRDGVVVSRAATVGASAEPGGDALFTVGDPGALWVLADVFESDMQGIGRGAKVQVRLSSLAHPVRGRVERVGAALSDATRRAPVYIAFDQPVAERLRPGALAQVGIEVASAPGLAIPLSAVLIKDERRSIVYVQKNGDETLFEARDVRLGLPLQGAITVLDGLRAGERIVVKGGLLLDGEASQLL
ncbi:MAG: efflux RND transporter periplasmic adaptor subunit [Xylophilus ampelinus]